MSAWQKNGVRSLLVIVTTAAVLVGAYFVIRTLSLRAKDPRFSVSNYIVFVEKFEDFAQPEQRSSLGFGSTDIIKEATVVLSDAVSNCRQYKVSQNESYRFDVKVSPKDRRFRIVGILTGADENPEASRCLREKISETRFERLSQLSETRESAYRLILGVQEARAATQE